MIQASPFTRGVLRCSFNITQGAEMLRLNDQAGHGMSLATNTSARVGLGALRQCILLKALS
jgi:hypothetical protein